MKQFQQLLESKVGSVYGHIKVTSFQNSVTVKGEVTSQASKDELKAAIKEVIQEMYPGAMMAIDVNVSNGLTIVSDEGSVAGNPTDRENPLDEVDIIFIGMLDIQSIKINNEYKMVNDNISHVMNNIYNVLEFTAPIILDSKLRVIDGNLRLRIAQDNGATEVPVVVINDDGMRADFLRLALNRSSEFQRWEYEEVDGYVDSVPQAQPLLEPLGFFGQKVLPESFFANTVVQYRIDPFNEQQTAYQQDEGLAEWAKVRRAEILEAEQKAKEQKKKRKPKANAVSLFSLIPEEDDFLETYDIDKEVDEHVEKMKEVAGKITDNYDEKRRKEMEARGQAWQGTRRSSKQVAADRRKEFLRQIDSHTELSNDEKERIIDQLEDITTSDELEALIEGVKNDE